MRIPVSFMLTALIRTLFFTLLIVLPAPALEKDSGKAAPLLPGMNEIEDFGSNPGNLTMHVYQPEKHITGRPPLIVALHGCGGSAEHFSRAGFNELAEKYGFMCYTPSKKAKTMPACALTICCPTILKRATANSIR